MILAFCVLMGGMFSFILVCTGLAKFIRLFKTWRMNRVANHLRLVGCDDPCRVSKNLVAEKNIPKRPPPPMAPPSPKYTINFEVDEVPAFKDASGNQKVDGYFIGGRRDPFALSRKFAASANMSNSFSYLPKERSSIAYTSVDTAPVYELTKKKAKKKPIKKKTAKKKTKKS